VPPPLKLRSGVGLFVRRGEQSFLLKKQKRISTAIPHASKKAVSFTACARDAKGLALFCEAFRRTKKAKEKRSLQQPGP